MMEALAVIKDAFITVLIGITMSSIKNKDEHSVEKILFLMLLFSF